MKQTSHLVIYKDGPRSDTMIFGPFVNRSMAESFSNDLPVPQQGGFRKYRITQPFTHSEARLVRDMIELDRRRELASSAQCAQSH